MKNQGLKIIFVTALLIITTSCSFTKSKALAESAVAQFHDKYNSGQFHDIYNQGDEAFRKSGEEASLVEYLEALRRKLGTVKKSTPTGWHVNVTSWGTMITLGYDTEFSEGKAMEQFVFRVTGDKALLYGYNVNSPLLITR